MPVDHEHDVRPPKGSGMREWTEVEAYACRRYARRRGRPIDDPDVLDYGQEVVLRVFRRYAADPEAYAIADEFLKLLLGVMKFVAREKWRALHRWQQLVTSISQRWEEFVSSPDPSLLDWQEDFDLIRVPVEARSGEKTYEAFRLVQFEGLSAREAADRLGTTPQAVYSAKFNVLERLIEEEGFMQLERLLHQLRDEPKVRRTIEEAKARCPRTSWELIDHLYGGDAAGRPDRAAAADASPKALYQARAGFLRQLEPLLLDLCRREEGLPSVDLD